MALPVFFPAVENTLDNTSSVSAFTTLVGTTTSLNGTINNLVTTINAISTSGFPISGVIIIDSEQISYTGISPTSFTGCTRGFNSTTAASHTNGAVITGGIDTSVTVINVASTTGFQIPGVLFIDSEQISYTSKTQTSFTGCIRGVNSTTAANHSSGVLVSAHILDKLPIVKLSTYNRSAFGGTAINNYLLPENSGGTVLASGHVGADSSKIYNTRSLVTPKMALLYSAHGGVVTPNFGQAIDNPNQPFNFAGIALTSSTLLQDLWDSKHYETPAPQKRRNFDMTFTGTSSVLFGGIDGTQYLGDTWEWDGKNWELKTGSVSGLPQARINHAMGYDSYNGLVYLNGGRNASNVVLGDTQPYAGGTWFEFGGKTLLTARERHSMAYDSKRQVMVMFSGFSGAYPMEVLTPGVGGDTWELDGTWVQATPVNVPPARYDYAMTFDSSRNKIVMFGGLGSGYLNGAISDSITTITVLFSTGAFPTSGTLLIEDEQVTYTGKTATTFTGCTRGANGTTAVSHGDNTPVYTEYNDTWEYDGITWTKVPITISSPSQRSQMRMVYNSDRKITLLFGGYSKSKNIFYNDTWFYDGSTWTEYIVNSPPIRSSFGMSYDALRNKIVLFGGSNTKSNLVPIPGLSDLWEFGGFINPIVVQTTGDGYVYYDASAGRPTPVAGDFLGPSAAFGTVTPLYDGYSPVFGVATEGPVIDSTNPPNPLNLTVNGSTVGIIKMRIRPFYGFIPPLAPAITGFNPSAAKSGDVVTLDGSVFVGATQVTINDTPSANATFSVVSNNQITFTVPYGSQKGTITVTNAQGDSTSSSSFITLPRIDLVSAAGSSVGSAVIIYGSTFTYTTSITFNGTNQPAFTIDNDAQINTTIPVGATTGPIVLTITYAPSDPHAVTYPNFGVVAAPTISNVAPLTGPIGAVAFSTLNGGISSSVTTITVVDTTGFPATGKIIIDTEIISYASKNSTQFLSCVRGIDAQFTTLNGSILATPPTGGTITVVSTTGFTSSGTIIIDLEQITYTGISATTFNNCVRGANSTTAATHSNGAIATQITAASHSNAAPVSSTQVNPTGYVSIIGTGFAVHGSQLDGYGTVQFVDVATQTQILSAQRTIFSDTSVSVIVPNPGVTQPSTAYYLRVTTDGGVVTSSQQFTIIPVPKFTPVASSTLSSGISGIDTSITVASASSFPTAGNFFIDNEQISYTGKSTNTFTGCTRGINGTTATSHSGSAAVTIKTFISQSNNTQGIAGEIVRIFGDYGFTGLSRVLFSGNAAPSIQFINDGYVTAIIPSISSPTDVTGAITVTSTGGTKSTTDSPSTFPTTFTVLQTPSINASGGVVPITGKTGDIISLFGGNMTGVTSVKFAGMTSSAIFSVVNSGRINVTVPDASTGITPSPNPGVITITKGIFNVSSTETFTYYPPPSGLSIFSPSIDGGINGGYGTPVTISGTNLSFGTPTVSFGGIGASVGSFSPASINTTVPSGANSGITVTNLGGSAGVGFAVLKPVSISSFSPHTATPYYGDVIHVYGSNFRPTGYMTIYVIEGKSPYSSYNVSYTFYDSGHISFSTSTLGAIADYYTSNYISITTSYQSGSYNISTSGLYLQYVIF